MSGATEHPRSGAGSENRHKADPVLLAADVKAWEVAATAGFSGPVYDHLIDRIIRHALPIMRRGLASGVIFRWCVDRNSQVKLWAPHDWCVGDRKELALDVVAEATLRFHNAALTGIGWLPHGGATLSSYFLGLCIDEFPNQFRLWLRARQRAQREANALEDPAAQINVPGTRDPLAAVEISEEFRRRLGRLPHDQCEAIVLQALGYTLEEIADRTGSTPKAVEGRIYRGRKRLKLDKQEEAE